ncbi:MAG: sugar ABC transporter ATP-binding protein [Verrucomicrobia subdivision 3 bacterium]|nr:sugar ABC transporter ATP-binding protein [Limisphaerales bacterium]
MSSELLLLRGITKSFPGVKALAGVDFTVRAGEIHALMGENGAGKSTLIKVLTGVHRRDSGDIRFAGKPIDPRSPSQAQSAGISTVYQEVNLIPYLSVAENICLGRYARPWIGWSGVRDRARVALKRLGVELDVTEMLSRFSIAIQQLVAIARALDISARVLVLDEPTSSLDEGEVERLFGVMRRLKAEGLGIVFVTHFLDQVYAVSDRITVLRNGKLVGEFEAAALPRLQLISKMMGREVSELDFAGTRASSPAAQSEVQDHSAGEAARVPMLQLRGLGRKGSLKPIDLDVAQGEVLGLSGLLGSGRTETARLIFGIDHPDTGRILIDGKASAVRSPLDAICHRFGFCPEDRKIEGIIPNLSVRENVVLALQASQGWTRYVSRARQLELAGQYIKALNIVTPSAEQPVRLLSGGNQQKVILARWLASHPRLLLLDEPTRGIDVGAKLEIEKLMARLTAGGMAILFISSDLEEMVRNSHRVVVLRDRRKVAELGPGQISEQSIMHAIAAVAE